MNNRYGGVIWTNHALKRLYERGLAQSDAWYAFQHPDGQTRGTSPGSLKNYKDYGQQRIEIVATQNEKKEWIILSCWSKLIGTGRPIFKQENIYWFVLKRLFQLFWNKLLKRKQKKNHP